jgi:PAS domain S-box-containing protein
LSTRLQRFAVAAASFLLAAGLTRAFWDAVFHRSPFALFFAASAVTAWFGGFWFGFGVALFGALTVSVLMGDPGPQIVAAALVTIGVATLISYLAERSRDTENQLDEAPVGIALFDRQLRFMRVNDAFVRMTGARDDAHIGRTVAEVMPLVDNAAIAAAFDQVLRAGAPVRSEVAGETRAAPGVRRTWTLYVYPLRVRGEVVGVGAVCEDVTEKREDQEELRRAMERAEAANEAKDHFLAKLSHELRTPLTPVLAIASVLEEEARIPAYARQHLSMIRRNVELEARLIDDLLDLTRISRGKVELRRARTDARPLVEEALRTCCQEDIDNGRIRVTTDFAAPSHDVNADAPRLLQVFWNLLNNATKFTPDGGSIHISSGVEAGQLVVSVADSGAGIETERLERIFDAFDQGDDTAVSTQPGRLGLGLAISRAVVRMHGGTIQAASAGRGQGATFTIRLPLLAPEMAQPVSAHGTAQEGVAAVEAGATGGTGADAGGGRAGGAGAAAGVSTADGGGIGGGSDARAASGEAAIGAGAYPAGEAAAGSRTPLRILLVEDHADTAEAMTDLLSSLGYRVTRAGTLSEALAAAEVLAGPEGRPPVDLVISDLGLPDGNGQDLMRELVRRYHLKGIALSGYGMEEDRQKSLQAGFARHLTKPVHWRTLQETIAQVSDTAA